VNKRLQQLKKKKDFNLMFYMAMILHQQINVMDLITIPYKSVRNNCQKELAYKQVEILMNLIIGDNPQINKNYDAYIYQHQNWSAVVQNNTYFIREFESVMSAFRKIIDITFERDDSGVFMYIINKLDQISKHSGNGKKNAFMTAIYNSNAELLHSEQQRDILLHNPKIVFEYLVYVRSSVHINPFAYNISGYNIFSTSQYFCASQYFGGGTVDTPTVAINKLLQLKYYNILYIVRAIYINYNSIEKFNNYLIYSITTLLFTHNTCKSIYAIVELPSHANFNTTRTIREHFNKILNLKPDVSYLNFKNTLELYFGTYGVDAFNFNCKILPHQLMCVGSLSDSAAKQNLNILIGLQSLVNKILNTVNDNITATALESKQKKKWHNCDNKCKLHFRVDTLEAFKSIYKNFSKIIKLYQNNLDNF
jgi:hypothetical protein